MCETRAAIEASLAKLVTELDPELLRGVDAKELVGYFSRLERLAGAGKALCALRASRTGVFELDGHRHAGEWLAAETGEQLSFVPEQLTGVATETGLCETAGVGERRRMRGDGLHPDEEDSPPGQTDAPEQSSLFAGA
jgi:hypothetical protein